MKLREAALELGVSITTVWRLSKKAGISIRPPRRCSETLDMFTGNTGRDDEVQHNRLVIDKLRQEKNNQKKRVHE